MSSSGGTWHPLRSWPCARAVHVQATFAAAHARNIHVASVHFAIAVGRRRRRRCSDALNSFVNSGRTHRRSIRRRSSHRVGWKEKLVCMMDGRLAWKREADLFPRNCEAWRHGEHEPASTHAILGRNEEVRKTPLSVDVRDAQSDVQLQVQILEGTRLLLPFSPFAFDVHRGGRFCLNIPLSTSCVLRQLARSVSQVVALREDPLVLVVLRSIHETIGRPVILHEPNASEPKRWCCAPWSTWRSFNSHRGPQGKESCIVPRQQLLSFVKDNAISQIYRLERGIRALR